ncbi:MAG TPA: hypothetical protein PLE30_09825 [Candidatus Kapabacteria bacterium]|nr:hypothetical protein [Candidatus Kapabacteria bacterium]
MPRKPIKIIELRLAVIQSVNKLIETGVYHSQKAALKYIIEKKPELSGFSPKIEKAYNQYRYFKSKQTNRNRQKQTKTNMQNLD